MSAPRIFGWVRDAAHDFGWRDIVCVLAIGVFPLLFGPHGGGLFVTLRDVREVDPLFDPSKHFIRGVIQSAATIGFPLVFALKVANRAIVDAVPRWLAYGAVLLSVGAVHHLFLLTALAHDEGQATSPGEIAWYYMTIFLQGGIGLVIYARWRAAQESMRLVQANETERARTAQQLQSARLLALQARVDPQLLFDSLGRVGVLQRTDPAAAEVLLSDLIALLRAMLPGATALTSTVEREFAVIDSWLRVTGAVSSVRTDVALRAAPAVTQCRLAPLLALPLLRAALDVPGAHAIPLQLDAATAGGRLLVTLGAAPGAETRAAEVLARADLAALRERLSTLHGDAAQLWLARPPTTVTLDLPFSIDDGEAPIEPADQPESAQALGAIAQAAAA
ncbi:MAG: histidine kinase [Caldimonas sp.]